jgi:predicted ribosomally synthesized peptide with SipW-like signal peptide
MFNRKKLAIVGATAAMSLGLVGMGTGAQWSDQVDANEHITTGTADLMITGYYNYQSSDQPESVSLAPDGQSITFTTPLEDASFRYVQDVYIRNVGTLPMKHAWYEITVAGDPQLTDNVYASVNDTADGLDAGYGFATGLQGYVSPGYAMPAGASTVLFFDFSAFDLPNEAQGKTMTFTVTFHGVDGDGGSPMLAVPETRS